MSDPEALPAGQQKVVLQLLGGAKATECTRVLTFPIALLQLRKDRINLFIARDVALEDRCIRQLPR